MTAAGCWLLAAGCWLLPDVSAQTAPHPAIVSSEFIFETAPFASAHASTIVETSNGVLVAAWFGGTREGASDVGIWLSRRTATGWSAPREVATGVQPDGTRFACWNPALTRAPDGTLLLFYKVGPQVAAWWGMLQTSTDGGATWSAPRRLPPGILGPIKNKPIWLPNGDLLAGSSTESFDSPPVWRIHFERTSDLGVTWSTVMPTKGNADEIEAIQPTILTIAGRLEALGRTRSGRIFETWSSDTGRTWSAVTLTTLPNPNSGIDAVTLRDGQHLIVYNPVTNGRTPLAVAWSSDGKAWSAPLTIESGPGEFSYPAVIQSSDGLIHVTYTWKRTRIRHVVLDPQKLGL